MTRKEMIEKLVEKGIITVFDEEIRNSVLDDFTYFIDDKWTEFETDGTNATDDSWKKGYLVEFVFTDDGIGFAAGLTPQDIANQPNWGFDSWEDIDDDQLEEFLKLQG